YPHVKPYFEKQRPDTFGMTFSQLGSKPDAGHLFFLTNTLPKNTSPTKKEGGEAIGIQSLGRHVFAFCRHRNGKSVYQIERDAEIAFITAEDLDAALTSAVEKFGFNWSSKQEGQKDESPSVDSESSTGAIEEFLKHKEHDKTLNAVLSGTYTDDRSKSDLVLAQKCAYYNLPEADAKHVLLHYGSSKCKERSDDSYIPNTVRRGFSDQKERWKKDKSTKTKKKSDGDLEIKRFIFDEERVNRKSIFPVGLIDETYYIGLLLPRDKDIYDKDGNFIRTIQVNAPALITSKSELLPVGEELLTKYRMGIDGLPAEYPLRWTLLSIFTYLKGEAPTAKGFEIFTQIRKQYEEYLYFADNEWYDIHALWDIGTYCFILFFYYPIFELRGLKGTAKNKIFAVSRGFTFNATDEMTNPSEATLFRDTAERRPAKYIDEAEKLFTVQNGNVEGDSRTELINASYKYTGTVPRMEKIGGRYVKISYSVYSPTMLASINGLYGATEDRAIIHITTKAPQGDKRSDMEPNPKDPIYSDVRDSLYIFTLQNAALIKKTYDELKVDGLSARELFLWKPLFAIAKVIDKKLFERVHVFAKRQADIKALDSITEDSQEWRMMKITAQILRNENIVLLVEVVKRYKLQFGEQYAPHSKTIAKHLDRIGFRQYKNHYEEGNGYEIPRPLFAQIVQSVAPSLYASESAIFASFTSAGSATRDKTTQTALKETEGNEEKEKKEEAQPPEATERNEANEDEGASEGGLP
ncbi:MAG: hypothetical protein NTV88_03570, partial [Candidatus Micrarchaeota archaeon]|nr:hypothetical protein [Candidatus Micrarchaeota archaeon]